jgi:hypothetical protein
MSGKDRLSREGDREKSSLRRAPKLNFGLICMLALAALVLVVALMFPEGRVTPTDLLSGP